VIRYTSFKEYKKDLPGELGYIDEEIISDAIFNSKEHLNLMVNDILENENDIDKKKAIEKAIVSYGYPSEIAEAYRIIQ